MEKILVTGAAGFIGFHLSKRLLDDGYQVLGVDNMNNYYDPALKHARLGQLKRHSNFEFFRFSIQSRGQLLKLFQRRRPKKVVSLAAQAGVRYSMEKPGVYLESNLLGFGHLLEACRRYQVEHLIFASSSSVYGLNTLTPFSEHDATSHPASLYAATKKANELMAHAYAHLFGLPVTGLRFFTVYGPWGRPDMAIYLFARAILERKPIRVFGRGLQRRDFTYIDDVIESILRLLPKAPQGDPSWSGRSPDPARSTAPYRVYNVGNKEPVELRVLIRTLERQLGRKARKIQMPLPPGDLPETHAETSELASRIDFSPRTPLELGMTHFLDWYRSYYR
jgi:UDP-glucuronate 4-epimerase